MKVSLHFFLRLFRGLRPLSLLLLLNNSCQPVTDSLRPQAGQVDNSPAVRAYIRSLGCPDSLIHDAGDHFLADGDMLFPKNMALPGQTITTDAAEEQAYIPTGGLIWNGLRQKRVRLTTTRTMSVYEPEIRAAMTLWNNSGSNIRFELVNRTTPYDVIVIQTVDPSLDDYYALAESPRNGKPGPHIIVNLTYFNPLARSQKITVLAHELGHTLGLAHTDWAAKNEPTRIDLAYTPTVERASIMNADLTQSGWPTRLTANDAKALRVIYPKTPYNIKLNWINPTTLRISWSGPLHPVKGYYVKVTPVDMESNGIPRTLWVVGTRAGLNVNVANPVCQCSVASLYEVEVQTVYNDDAPPGKLSRSAWTDTAILYAR
ncbi:M57 family metalloprotease [Spirosoma sp. 209]|uniref:M57 family metalloprotease n=1 Tax=Spirosoma sp. 209 TaxID=1955701 RepID=UPI001115B70C|nr:M57 family metalloprotease [Spirosoma sp. 209]